MSSARTPDPRLSRESWIEAAMDVLASLGVDAVRVEALARALNVTKGSFYWHFKNRDQLLEAMLDHWRRRNTADLMLHAGSSQDPLRRLREIAQMPFRSDQRDPLGLPIRLWALRDERARKTVEEVDELRLQLLTQLFAASGLPIEAAQARSILLYSYMRTIPTLSRLTHEDLHHACERLLLGDLGSELGAAEGAPG